MLPDQVMFTSVNIMSIDEKLGGYSIKLIIGVPIPKYIE